MKPLPHLQRTSRATPTRAQRLRVGLALILGSLVACAHYSTTSGLIGGIRSVAIPVAENETAEYDIADLLTEHLGDAFARDGQLRVVDEESADAVMLLRVVSLDDRPFTYTADEQTEQYRFRVYIDAELRRLADDDELLALQGVDGWGTYDAGLPDEEGRDQAIEAALDMIIEEILDRTTASW